MSTVAIVQARMGSSRLRGKVMAAIDGTSMLGCVVDRLRRAKTIDSIVIATTVNMIDEIIVAEGARLGVRVFRGSEPDVLARYADAAWSAGASVIVRVTSDCPLLDPQIVDRVVGALGTDCDYASNTHIRSFPRGLDVEAMHRDTLERIERMATSRAAREHVTAHILEHPERFVVRQVVADRDDSDLRWTVDTDEDLAVVRRLAALRLGYRELADVARADRALHANSHVIQKVTFS